MKKLLLALLIAVMVTICFPVVATADEPPEGYYLTLGKWIYHTFGNRFSWEAPPNTISLIDLRGVEPSTIENPGYALFVCTTPYIETGYIQIGRLWADEFPVVARNFFRNRYDITLEAYTCRGLIWELFCEEGDPTGLNRWKPLQPGIDGKIVINLDGYSPVEFWKDPPKHQCWNWKHKWPTPKGWHWGWNKWGRWEWLR